MLRLREQLLGIVLKHHCSQDDTKLGEDDSSKGKIYESSTDSGFISSSIITEEFSSNLLDSDREAAATSPADTNTSSRTDQEAAAKLQEEMRLRSITDSGVGLSDSFSNLKLGPDTNDLSSSKKTRTVNQYGNIPESKKEDLPWELFYERDEDGDTQLHTAILNNFLEVVIALIRGAPQPRYLDILNDDLETPLHLATSLSQWRIVRWLIVAGARPSIRNRYGDTALHIACRLGDIQSVKAILEPIHQQERASLSLKYPPQVYQPVELDEWNYNGKTCVHVAAVEGHVHVLRHLVWYGADINARDLTSGYTVLHYAVEYGDEKLMQFLLQECKKLNVQALTYQGYSAFDVSRSIPSNIAKDLKSKGAPSPCSSSDELDSDSDTEMLYEPSKYPTPNLINASA